MKFLICQACAQVERYGLYTAVFGAATVKLRIAISIDLGGYNSLVKKIGMKILMEAKKFKLKFKLVVNDLKN